MTKQRLDPPKEMEVPNRSAEPADPVQPKPMNPAMTRQAIRHVAPVVAEEHREQRRRQLRQAASQLGWQDPGDILRQLAVDYGISWAAIAKMLGVSPTAVRKWRRGESVSADRRGALAHLLAVLQHAQASQPIADIGRWLEVRVVDESWLTPIDLFAMGATDPLLDWLGSYLSVTEMLDEIDEDWRNKYARDNSYEVAEGPAGQRSIVPREG